MRLEIIKVKVIRYPSLDTGYITLFHRAKVLLSYSSTLLFWINKNSHLFVYLESI